MSEKEIQELDAEKLPQSPTTEQEEGKKRGCLVKAAGAVALLFACGIIFALIPTDTDSSSTVSENTDKVEARHVELEATSTASVQPTETAEMIGENKEDGLIADGESVEESPSPTATATKRPQLRIVNSSVNIRSGPGTEYDPVGVLFEDDLLPLLGTNDGKTWFEVKLEDGSTGWVGSTVAILDSGIVPGLVVESELAELTASSESSVEAQSIAEIVPTETSTPAPPLFVEISQVSEFDGSEGSLILIGEVTNLGSEPAKDIDIRTTLYDENSNILSLDTGSAKTPLWLSLWFTGVLYPGEKAPFWTSIDDPGEWETKKHEIFFEKAEESDYADHYVDLEVINDTGRYVNDLIYNYQVAGEIMNTGEKTTGPVRIVITLYDEQGNVVGQQHELSEDEELKPGHSTPFKVLAFARGPAVSYSVLMRAIKQ